MWIIVRLAFFGRAGSAARPYYALSARVARDPIKRLFLLCERKSGGRRHGDRLGGWIERPAGGPPRTILRGDDDAVLALAHEIYRAEEAAERAVIVAVALQLAVEDDRLVHPRVFHRHSARS